MPILRNFWKRFPKQGLLERHLHIQQGRDQDALDLAGRLVEVCVGATLGLGHHDVDDPQGATIMGRQLE